MIIIIIIIAFFTSAKSFNILHELPFRMTSRQKMELNL